MAPAALAQRAPVTYHVDCRAGRDGAEGTAPETAWRTVSRASLAPVDPGDSLLFLRGCTWGGTLVVSRSGTEQAPITIGAYGEGDLPIIQNSQSQIDVKASWVVLTELHVRADPPKIDRTCRDQPAGYRFGIRFTDGATHDVLRDSLVTELYTGVRVERGADHIRILDNVFRDNNMKSDDPGSDSGAVAIDLQGDDNEVAGNRISGSDACSPFFGGHDGSAISVYGGRRNVIHHNVSFENHDFIELGHPRTRDTLIVYNTDRSNRARATFLVVHGVGSRYGPVLDTRVFHNTAVLTDPESEAVSCARTVTAANLSLRGNILWAEGSASSCGDNSAFDEGDNIYWRSDGEPVVTYDMAPSSRTVAPRLLDARGGDFRLSPDSPAIDAILPLEMEGYGDVDAGGTAVPQGFTSDIGAYEFVPPAATSLPVGSSRPDGSPGAPGSSPTESPTPTPTPTPSPPPPPTGGSGVFDGLLLVGILAAGGLGLAGVLMLRRPD